MTNRQKWFVICMFLLGVMLVPLYSQLQQSGGPSTLVQLLDSGGTNKASISAGGALKVDGSAVTQPVSLATAPTTPVTGTFWQPTQPVSLASMPALAAGSNIIGKAVQATTCGATPFSQAWAAVPTTSTSLTATTTCVYALMFTNTNSTPQSVTVTDGEATPVTIVPTFSIPANSQVTFPFYGAPATTGLKWSAGGAGVNGSVSGVQ